MRKKKHRVILENVLVEDYAAEGKSLARVDGKVVFVEQAVPGDVVDVMLDKNKKDWANGFPVQYKSLSPDRLEAFCAHFGVCGGCQWQMLPYEKQLQYKQKQVGDQLSRIGKAELPQIETIAGCQETVRYRNKMEYTFSPKRYIPGGEFRELGKEKAFEAQHSNAAGFHARGTFDKIVDIHTCHLQAEPTNGIRLWLKNYCEQQALPFYDIKAHQGFIRNVIVRTATTGELMVNVVVASQEKKVIHPMLEGLLQAFPGITTLLYTSNLKWNESLFDLEPVAFHGKGYIIEKLGGYQYKISPKSFFQTNSRQAETLYSITRNFANLTGNEVVYDLYCGTGSIGIFVSDLAKKIVGVEVVADAIRDAKENAALNNIEHTAFFAGDVIEVCNDDFFATHGRPDVIITDPPRAGMHEKLVNKLLEIAAPLIVYVSCNPATQARDLALLSDKYAITRIQPVDMFPHTHHIENVVQLTLKKEATDDGIPTGEI